MALGTSGVRIQRENALGKSRVPLPRMVVVAFGHHHGHSTATDVAAAQGWIWRGPDFPCKGGTGWDTQLPSGSRAPRQQRAPGVPEPVSARGRREGALWERVLECHGWYLKRSLRALNKIFQFQGAVRSRGGHQK